MTEDKRNCVVLARVSSKAQEDEGYSLDAQLKLMLSYCQKNNLHVVKTFKIAETASKERSRRIFHEMIQFLYKEKDVQHLIVEKTDRFARNFKDAVTIDEWLEADETRFLHAVKENILLHKHAKSDVKFMWNIHMSVAKKYTDNLREETMKGQMEKLAQGWLPAYPPPGYMTITKDGKRIHVPNPETKGIMQLAFKKYLKPDVTIKSLTRELEGMGLVSRKGRPYAKSHIQNVLTNPFYIGLNRFNGIDYPGKQEPIISRQLFNAVQTKMHNGRPIHPIKHDPMFKNMITCTECNGTVTWQLQKGRYYGYCQRRNNLCRGNKAIREDSLIEYVKEKLKQLVCPSPELIDWAIKSIRDTHYDDHALKEQQIKGLQLKLDRINRMDSEMYDDKLAGEISREVYAQKHSTFQEEIAELSDQLNKVSSGYADITEQAVVLLELSQRAAELFDTRNTEQKRVIMTKLFSSITSTGGVVSVKYTKFAEVVANNTLKTKEIIGG